MIKKILLATNLSSESEITLNRAVLLAKKWSAELIILHVVKKSICQNFFLNKENTYLALQKKAEFIFENTLKNLLAAGVTVSYSVLLGDPAKEILRFIEQNSVDFLILGPHEHGFFHDWFLGSTAEKVIRQSAKPVLIVKKEVKEDYSNIIIAVNFSDAAKKMIELSSALIPEADYTLLHVTDPWYEEVFISNEGEYNHQRRSLLNKMTAELIQQMNRFLKGLFLPRKKHTSIKMGYPATVIASMVVEMNSDLVVIGKGEKSPLYYVIFGSLANRILHEANVDILMFPANKVSGV